MGPSPVPSGACDRLEQQSGAGDADDVGGHVLVGEAFGGGEHFGDHRAHADQRDRRVFDAPQRICACDHLSAAAFPAGRIGGHRGEFLVHRAGREP